MNGENLPYTDLDVVPFTPITSEWGDGIGEDILALAAGTGLDDGAVSFAKTTGIWWEEIGRTTLGSAGDTITVSSLPARKYLLVIIKVIDSGSINVNMRFNADTGNTYAGRDSKSGAAEATYNTQSNLFLNPVTAATPMTIEALITNEATQEKILYFSGVARGTAGAGNVPARTEGVGKWSNTSSQISRIDVFNNSTGDYAAGSEVVVLGHD